jgi:hypothetical protein
MKYNITLLCGKGKWWKWRPSSFWRKNKPSGVIDMSIDWLCLWIYLMLRPKHLVTGEPSIHIRMWNRNIIKF